MMLDIGTAGSTALVLQTLHLAIALRTDRPVRVTLRGGTFNLAAPSYPFLATTWRSQMAALGAPVALSMPLAGFYPRGGGELDAWIEPARLQGMTLLDRGPLVRITGTAGVSRLPISIAERLRNQAFDRLAAWGLSSTDHEIAIALQEWPSIPRSRVRPSL